MIEYIPQHFFIAHWFVDQPSLVYRKETGVPNMNWIAAVWRRPDGLYEAKMRFAYYDDRERTIRSSWQSFSMREDTPREKLVEGFDMIAKMTSARHGDAMWERVDLDLPGDEAFLILLEKPWMRIVGKEGDFN